MNDDVNDGFAAARGDEPLGRLDDYEVADGYPDVRGWTVEGAGGQKLGTVRELLVDTSALEVRYLVVDTDDDAGIDTDGVRVPIESVQFADDDSVVLLNANALDASLATPFAATAPSTDVDATLVADRTADEAHVTRSEEELVIGKRRVAAGQIGVRKRVETEHVSTPVTLEREEVSIERRPVVDGAARAAAETAIGEGEIRVPIVEEELVVEKRPVVKEELVIRTKQVTEEKEVHADVRREQVDIDRDTTRTSRTERSAGQGDLRDETPGR